MGNKSKSKKAKVHPSRAYIQTAVKEALEVSRDKLADGIMELMDYEVVREYLDGEKITWDDIRAIATEEVVKQIIPTIDSIIGTIQFATEE